MDKIEAYTSDTTNMSSSEIPRLIEEYVVLRNNEV